MTLLIVGAHRRREPPPPLTRSQPLDWKVVASRAVAPVQVPDEGNGS